MNVNISAFTGLKVGVRWYEGMGMLPDVLEIDLLCFQLDFSFWGKLNKR